MNTNLLQGQLVRLTAIDAEANAELLARWWSDSEYMRLLDSDPPRPLLARKIKEEFEKDTERYAADRIEFMIRTLAADKPIGFIALDGIRWTHGDTFVAIGLGDRDYWGKGYGTDAMNVMLRYAFTELNLQRVSLDVFEYNARARRSYEKAGFVVEGCQRQRLNRDGQRWGFIYMGVLRDEWLKANEP